MSIADRPIGDFSDVVPPAATETPTTRGRLQSLDAARGFAVVLMLVVMNPGPTGDLPAQLHHPEWHGFTLADTALPLFLFASGLSMTLSRRSLDRRQVLRRVGLLFGFGVALATLKHEALTFNGVLQHLAGAYLLAWEILRLPRRAQLPAAAGLVGAVWVAFAAWGAGGDPWAAGDTLAHQIDGVLYGGFATEGTLQTIASASTVVAGAFVGRLVRSKPSAEELVGPLAIRAVGFVTAGLLLALVVPLNKHLWTPSYSVLTIGTSLTILALGLWLIDVCGMRRITEPLVHMGANPIVIYLLAMAVLFAIRNYADTLLPTIDPFGAVVYAAGWTAVWWLLARALHRRKVFVKI